MTRGISEYATTRDANTRLALPTGDQAAAAGSFRED